MTTEAVENQTVEQQAKGKKNFVGDIVSTKMNKTVTVLITTKKQDSKYKKYVAHSKKYLVHVPDNLSDTDYRVGSVVQIEECRPVSKRKSFYLKKVIKFSHE